MVNESGESEQLFIVSRKTIRLSLGISILIYITKHVLLWYAIKVTKIFKIIFAISVVPKSVNISIKKQ
jgi:hypothetical protein